MTKTLALASTQMFSETFKGQFVKTGKRYAFPIRPTQQVRCCGNTGADRNLCVTELIQVFRKSFKQRATRAREKQLNVRRGLEILTKHDVLLERKSPVEWPERRQYYAEQCCEKRYWRCFAESPVTSISPNYSALKYTLHQNWILTARRPKR